MESMARHWYFRNRPAGSIDDDTLEYVTEAMDPVPEGGFLVRTLLLSLDATNRVWLSDWDIYMDPVHIGDRMRGFVLGEVVASDHKDFPEGSLVTGLSTWSTYIATQGDEFQPFICPPGVDLAEAFGALAVAGPTAIHGLLTIGEPKAGETVLVSAAAGAVGQLVGQLAKLQGCHVVGIAGGAEKCQRLTERFAYDAAVDYKQGDMVSQLGIAAPEGVDVLFENVGGDVLDAGLTVMNDFGRVVICGLISGYNAKEPSPGPYMFRNVIMRRLRIEGFVILDHVDRYAEYQQRIGKWMQDGQLNFDVHVVEGLDQGVEALKLLYSGGNNGKLMVKVGERDRD